VKLIIQIPCFNEEKTLPVTLADLPREVEGVESVEWLVVDDGSTDGTAEVARRLGVDHVVRLPRNRGLAAAFVAGLEAGVDAGADIIVNTDADNQYCADDIPALIRPILEGQAQIVVGERPISETPHFSPLKKALQRFGSWVVRRVSGTEIPDSPSGFRAMSREAAQRLQVFNKYSYTLETVIQAGQKGMAITSVPVRTNPALRPSRLFRSSGEYLARQAMVITRIFMTYRPFAFFAVPGIVLFLAGFGIGGRFVYYFVVDSGAGRVQSLILAALLLGTGFFLGVVGLLADLASVNRTLLEGLDWRLRKMEDRLNHLAEPRDDDAGSDPGHDRDVGEDTRGSGG
jgi:glycosyltransferase involved in cell wall biosynthesis